MSGKREVWQAYRPSLEADEKPFWVLTPGRKVGWFDDVCETQTLERAQQIANEHNAHGDMLEALRAVLHWYDEDSTEFNRDMAMAKVRAAIAKASPASGVTHT